MNNGEFFSSQNVVTSLANKQQIKKFTTRIHALTIRNKIRKVLMNTESKIIRRHQAIENQRLKLANQLKNLKEYQEYLHEFKLCEIWDDNGKIQTFQSEQPDNTRQQYEQMLKQLGLALEQIKNDSKDLTIIMKDLQENGLSRFKEFQQKQQSNFIDIKKTVHEINDFYEEDQLKIDKLDQIFICYYNLSLQPCGICLVQPEINQIMILDCGHSLCENCFQGFRTSERTKTYFRRCPFCRQQIEFIANEQIIKK